MRVDAADLPIQVLDDCDEHVDVRIASVESDQPEDGTGDGHTAPDVYYGDDALCVRSERQGTDAEGRTYTVTLVATDSAGNEASATVTIEAPHDRSEAACETEVSSARASAEECESLISSTKSSAAPRGSALCTATPGTRSASDWTVFATLVAGALVVIRRRRRA